MAETQVIPLRKPQQARSAATRRRLLAATVDCLVDRGWAGVTTTEVGQRAGVSQGAIFKHFPNKNLLIAAAVELLFADLIEEFRRALGPLAGRGRAVDRVGRAIAVLWPIFCEPRLHAAYELYLAARTDAELRQALSPVLGRHRSALHGEAARLFPAAAGRPEFPAAVDTVLNALQGAALGAIPLPDPDAERAWLRQLAKFARRELGEAEEGQGAAPTGG